MKVDLSFCYLLPEKSGCYIIRHRDIPLYIGQSANLKKRWSNHQHRGFMETLFPDATMEIVLCDVQKLDEKEKELIYNFCPITNGLNGSQRTALLHVPANWHKKSFNIKKWMEAEDKRYEIMKARQEYLMKIRITNVVLNGNIFHRSRLANQPE